MTWLYLIVMIFSALTLYFTYGEYKQNRFSKKACSLLVLCLNFRVEVGMVPFHDLGKLADVEHIAQTAHVKVIIIQMFQPCRKATPIRVIHLYNSTIGNAGHAHVVRQQSSQTLAGIRRAQNCWYASQQGSLPETPNGFSCWCHGRTTRS